MAGWMEFLDIHLSLLWLMELVVGDCWLDFGFFVDNLWSELP